MQRIEPTDEQQLAEALRDAAEKRQAIRLGGCFSKDRMAGGCAAADVLISTARMDAVLQYHPHDLTISVLPGMRFAELTRKLAEHRQMVPLDPPYFDCATVGGVVATNSSGPRRRLYGSARDLVIGMAFATLEGKLVKSGGMVVKNVAGLDMAKLMIGSFGTLAAIASVNFKVVPIPPETRTFLARFDDAQQTFAERDRILQSVLQPAAIDVLNPAASKRLGLEPAFTLAVQAGGSTAVLDRYQKELAAAWVPSDESIWTEIREFTPRFVAANTDAQVVRVSSTLAGTREVLASFEGPAIARAGSGVIYGHFESAAEAQEWTQRALGWRYIFEYGEPRSAGVLGSEFAVMEKMKNLFDPGHLLNRGRLYGRL